MKSSKVSANNHESYGTMSVLAIVIPIVGLILGVVYLTKDQKVDRKLGEHLIAVSLISMVLWSLIYYMFLMPDYYIIY